ncbi:MAG: hypothetical protein WC748_09745 [Legionellales bacterium]|jgi:cytochrome c556
MGKFVYLNQLSVAAQTFFNGYYSPEGTISESRLEAAVNNYIANTGIDLSTEAEVNKVFIELSSYSVTIAKIVKEKIDKDQSLSGNDYFTETFTPALLDYFYLPKNDPQKFNAAVSWLKTLQSNKPLNKLWPLFFTSRVSSAQLVINDKIESNSDTLQVNMLAEHAKYHPGILESLLREKPWWNFFGADPVSHKLTPKQLMDLLFIYRGNENYRIKICDLLLRQGYFDTTPFMRPYYDTHYVAMISAAKNGNTLALSLCVERENALNKVSKLENKLKDESDKVSQLKNESGEVVSLKLKVKELTEASEEVKQETQNLEIAKAKLQGDQEKFSTLKEQYLGEMNKLDTQLSSKMDELKTKTTALGEKEKAIAEKQASLFTQETEIKKKHEELVQKEREIFAKDSSLKQKEKNLKSLEEDLKRTDVNLREREELLNDYDQQKQKEELAKPQNMDIAAPNFSLSSAGLLAHGIDKPDFEVDDYDNTNVSEQFSNSSTTSGSDSDNDDDDDYDNNILDNSSFMDAANKVNSWKYRKRDGNISFNSGTDVLNMSPIKPSHAPQLLGRTSPTLK